MKFWLCLLPLLVACSPDPMVDAGECKNQLTAAEADAGWQLLFDGRSLEQWRSYKEETLNSGWGIENGCLTRLGMGGDIISRQQFEDFELKLQWRISEAGNSGIFIRGDESGKNIHQTGYEMQVLDNVGHSDNEVPSHRAGAYYDMIVPDHDTTQPVGYWNRVHIIARGPHVEFWLNERRTARFICVLAIAHQGETLATFEGVIEGRLLEGPQGANGFGYDPLFFHPPSGCTTAELSTEAKQLVSHRGKAVAAFLAALRDEDPRLATLG